MNPLDMMLLFLLLYFSFKLWIQIIFNQISWICDEASVSSPKSVVASICVRSHFSRSNLCFSNFVLSLFVCALFVFLNVSPDSVDNFQWCDKFVVFLFRLLIRATLNWWVDLFVPLCGGFHFKQKICSLEVSNSMHEMLILQ